MKDLYIGDFEPEDDGMNSAGGILGNEGKSNYDDDVMTRAVMGLAFICMIVYLFTVLA